MAFEMSFMYARWATLFSFVPITLINESNSYSSLSSSISASGSGNVVTSDIFRSYRYFSFASTSTLKPSSSSGKSNSAWSNYSCFSLGSTAKGVFKIVGVDIFKF